MWKSWLFQISHLKDVETIAVQEGYRKPIKLLANRLGQSTAST